MEQPVWKFEQEPYEESPDEATINLRAWGKEIMEERSEASALTTNGQVRGVYCVKGYEYF
jgi:hypothetical protein